MALIFTRSLLSVPEPPPQDVAGASQISCRKGELPIVRIETPGEPQPFRDVPANLCQVLDSGDAGRGNLCEAIVHNPDVILAVQVCDPLENIRIDLESLVEVHFLLQPRAVDHRLMVGKPADMRSAIVGLGPANGGFVALDPSADYAEPAPRPHGHFVLVCQDQVP